MKNYLARKYQAQACKFKVVRDFGPQYCTRFVSKHLTLEKAQAVCDDLNEGGAKKYVVEPIT